MNNYVGAKIISATPMDENTFLTTIKGKEVPENSETRAGYLVVYPDGYKSWSPADVFDTAYRKVDSGEELLITGKDTVTDTPFDILMTEYVETAIYPSTDFYSVSVVPDEIYGGAHLYSLQNSRGFEDGETVYDLSHQEIQFVHKADDGTVTPGLLSEQLVIALIDRHQKLNARFPSPQNEKMIDGLQMFLDAAKERAESRIQAGVMGKLENIPEDAAETEETPEADSEELNFFHIELLKSANSGIQFSYPEDDKPDWEKAAEYLLKEGFLTPATKGRTVISNKGITALTKHTDEK